MGTHFGKEVAFSLEGKFLGFEFEDGYKRKYLRLETSEGEYSIKLAKYLRSSFQLDLQPGDRVQIFGEKKFNPKKGILKLKAEQVICTVNTQATIPVPLASFATSNKEPKKGAKTSPTKASILVCQKSDCIKRGGKGICQALQAALGDRGLENEVAIKATGCLKQCKAGPNIVMMPDKTRYSKVQVEQIAEIVDRHFATAKR